MEPVYRLTVFEDDGTTVLTPEAAAHHSDAFKVATSTGVTGFQPYLLLPRGRRGRIDPLNMRTDTGWISVGLLDVGAASDQAKRWVTAFLGDIKGENQILGKPCLIEESTDGGSVWSSFFRGRVQDCEAPLRSVFGLTVRDTAEDQNTRIFVETPRVSYAEAASILPLGIPVSYGAHPTVPLLAGTVQSWSFVGRGAGKFLEIDQSLIAGRDTDGVSRIITREYQDRISNVPGELFGGAIKHARIHLSWPGNSGECWPASYAVVGPIGFLPTGGQPVPGSFETVQFETDGPIFFRFLSVALQELDPSDPDYVALPVAGTDVDFWISAYGPPTEDAPFLIDWVHPVQLWKDILDGKFGPHNDQGVALTTVPYDSTAFTNLIADKTIPDGRWTIDKPVEMADFIEKQLCLPYGLSYRLNSDGEVVPLDMRAPTAIPATSILESDLAEEAPGWQQDRGDAIAWAEAEYYADEVVPVEDIKAGGGGFVDIETTRLKEHRLTLRLQVGKLGITDRVFKLKAQGYRLSRVVLQKLFNQTTEIWVPRTLEKRLDDLRSPFGQGQATVSLVCKRTANVTGCFQGDDRKLTVAIPNAATYERSGDRVGRCIGRQEDGVHIHLEFLDLGAALVAVAPTLGTLRLNATSGKHDVEVSVTRNGTPDDVVLMYAVTPTSTVVRPVESDPAWTFGGRVTANGFFGIGSLPSGMRIWVRGRSEGAPNQAKIPSAWVFPTPDKIDTTAMTAPSAFNMTMAGCQASGSWTNGEANETIELTLDGVTYDILPPGVTNWTWEGLVTSTAYTFGLRYIDGFGGVTALVTDTDTTSATPDTAPSFLGLGILAGVPQ